MKTLTYWIAKCSNDHPTAYALRGKSRKECAEKVAKMVADPTCASRFNEPEKVTVEYENLVDLITVVTGEWSPE
jgi:hypothetical protein